MAGVENAQVEWNMCCIPPMNKIIAEEWKVDDISCCSDDDVIGCRRAIEKMNCLINDVLDTGPRVDFSMPDLIEDFRIEGWMGAGLGKIQVRAIHSPGNGRFAVAGLTSAASFVLLAEVAASSSQRNLLVFP